MVNDPPFPHCPTSIAIHEINCIELHIGHDQLLGPIDTSVSGKEYLAPAYHPSQIRIVEIAPLKPDGIIVRTATRFPTHSTIAGLEDDAAGTHHPQVIVVKAEDILQTHVLIIPNKVPMISTIVGHQYVTPHINATGFLTIRATVDIHKKSLKFHPKGIVLDGDINPLESFLEIICCFGDVVAPGVPGFD